MDYPNPWYLPLSERSNKILNDIPNVGNSLALLTDWECRSDANRNHSITKCRIFGLRWNWISSSTHQPLNSLYSALDTGNLIPQNEQRISLHMHSNVDKATLQDLLSTMKQLTYQVWYIQMCFSLNRNCNLLIVYLFSGRCWSNRTVGCVSMLNFLSLAWSVIIVNYKNCWIIRWYHVHARKILVDSETRQSIFLAWPIYLVANQKICKRNRNW